MTNIESEIRKQTAEILDAYKECVPIATLSASDFIVFRKQAIEELGVTGAFRREATGSAPSAAGPESLFEIRPEYETLRSPVSGNRAKRAEHKQTTPDDGLDAKRTGGGFAMLKQLEDPWN